MLLAGGARARARDRRRDHVAPRRSARPQHRRAVRRRRRARSSARPDARGSIGPVVLGSDGAHAGLIVADRDTQLLAMDGHETFKQAVRRLAEGTVAACERAAVELCRHRPVRLPPGQQPDPAHSLAERLELRAGEGASTASESSATPRRRASRSHSRRRARTGGCDAGVRMLLAAAGAGFTWGACVAEWGALMTETGEPGPARGRMRARDRRLARDRRRDRAWRSPPTAGRWRSTIAAAPTAQRPPWRRSRRQADAPSRSRATFPTRRFRRRCSTRSTSGSDRSAVLVNNAGVRADGLALTLSDEDWAQVLDTNLGVHLPPDACRAARNDPRPLRPGDQHRFGRSGRAQTRARPTTRRRRRR